jgi:hypothetical protein
MGALKTLLVLGGAGVALNELTKSDGNRSANVSGKATTPKPTLDTQAVLKAIRENPDLLALVRGEKGDNGNGYKATSTSSTAIATGSKSFDVGTANLAYLVGARVRISATSDVTKFMEGVVTAYTGTTLTVNVDTISGTGTLASWNINVAGERGATGATGDVRGFGGSLFTNSALENGNIDHLVPVAGVNLNTTELLNTLPSLEIVTTSGVIVVPSTQRALIDTSKLYKITFYAKVSTGTASVSVRLKCYNKSNVVLDKAFGDPNSAYENFTVNTSFALKTSYLGGVGTGSGSQKFFHPDTLKAVLYIVSNDASKTVYFNRIVVQEVSLGEPVPYTLQYLPTGQMVVDPTTSEVGYYNGTSVVWFAA